VRKPGQELLSDGATHIVRRPEAAMTPNNRIFAVLVLSTVGLISGCRLEIGPMVPPTDGGPGKVRERNEFMPPPQPFSIAFPAGKARVCDHDGNCR
jgi:hypothetical protein